MVRSRVLLFLSVYQVLYSVNCLSDRTIEALNNKEKIVRRIAAHAAELFERRTELISKCTCSIHTCSFQVAGKTCHQELGTPRVCKDCEGQNLNYNSSVVNTPRGTDPMDLSDELKESICVYQGLESTFSELYPNDYLWTYMATTDGHSRLFPAVGRDHNQKENNKLQGCRHYDPRGRPWYVAASTGPKDIVFVIDRSDSMLGSRLSSGTPSKWDTTTNAVMSMLDTLSTGDFANVVVFSDEAEQLWTENSLVRATAENKEEMKKLFDRVTPKGGTNFNNAFGLAFNLLSNACSVEGIACSNCEKVIIFLTDGKDTSRSLDGGIRPSEMAAKIAGYQDNLFKATSKRASIFTFSFGRNADDSIPRQIACNNDGSWSFIKDTDDPLTVMRSYYLFLASRRASRQPVWSEPYLDDLGLGMITTVSLPVYSKSGENQSEVFLGVVGHDALFSDIGSTDSETNDVLSALVNRSTTCNPSEINDCQLQVLRNIHADKATCIDRFPINSVPASEEDNPQCFTNGPSFYKRFSSLVSWEEARNRCADDGGALASIGSAEELAFVANMASDDGSWIGARRKFDAFVWLEALSPSLNTNSPAWGIGQPDSYQGIEDCVSIDTRGPTGNLNDAPCEDKLSFICEYATDGSCEGDILHPRDQPKQYFSVPPIGLCIGEEESLDRFRPTKSAATKSSSDVLCPLGTPRGDADIQCCSGCSSTSGLSPLVTAMVLLAIVMGLLLIAGMYYASYKWKGNHSTKNTENEPEPSPRKQTSQSVELSVVEAESEQLYVSSRSSVLEKTSTTPSSSTFRI